MPPVGVLESRTVRQGYFVPPGPDTLGLNDSEQVPGWDGRVFEDLSKHVSLEGALASGLVAGRHGCVGFSGAEWQGQLTNLFTFVKRRLGEYRHSVQVIDGPTWKEQAGSRRKDQSDGDV